MNTLAKDVVSRSSWWDLYGIDLAITRINFALLPISLLFMGSFNISVFVTGYLLFSYIHATFTVKLAHAAVHYALAGSSHFWNGLLSIFLIEIWGGFTVEGSYEAHIQFHHPYTNVIGLGDSSSWRVPFLGRNTYLFIAPLFLQLLYPAVGLKLLAGRWWSKARFLCYYDRVYNALLFVPPCSWSVSCRSYLLPHNCAHSFCHSLHPRQSMYDVKKRPKRLYQMASSALSLPRNPLLDFSFGHSVISCHVEHHLFPRLSDNMCLKIKPVVSSYLKSNGLPYHEAPYLSQLWKFYNNYDELMVKAPPITELIGIQ